MIAINETLPKVVVDYVEMGAGQIMLEAAICFRWSLDEEMAVIRRKMDHILGGEDGER